MSMQQTVPHAGSVEAPVALDAIVQSIWSRSGGLVHSDLRGDCEVEAELVLWCVSGRLETLPEEERSRSAATCVRRAVFNVIQVEIRSRIKTVSLEALQAENEAIEPASERDTAAEAIARGCLLDQIDQPDLAAMIALLPSHAQRVLDLSYREELTDREIAAELGLSLASVKKQRQRALGKARCRPAPADAGQA